MFFADSDDQSSSTAWTTALFHIQPGPPVDWAGFVEFLKTFYDLTFYSLKISCEINRLGSVKNIKDTSVYSSVGAAAWPGGNRQVG